MFQNPYDKKVDDLSTPIQSSFPLATNDEAELTRSELLHKVFGKIWGFDFVSPIKQKLTNGGDIKVLDVGCGSGEWTLQLSNDYPLAKFVGLDVVPLFPKEISQNNLQFVQGDILKGLPFEDNTFDFVHLRMLINAFTPDQWDEIVAKEMIRVCKPGGWIELVDFDIDGKSMGPAYKRLITFVTKYLETKGINSLMSEDIPDIFENTDQVDTVNTDEIYVALGSWGGEIGKLAIESFIPVLTSLRKDLPRTIGISEEEYKKMLSQFLEESHYYRSYFSSIRFNCQKLMY